VRHPDWLFKRVNEKNDAMKQTKLEDIFAKAPELGGNNDDDYGSEDSDQENQAPNKSQIIDLEDVVPDKEKALLKKSSAAPLPLVHKKRKQGKNAKRANPAEEFQLEPVPEVVPDPNKDYQAYLEYNKIVWRNLRKEKKKRKLLDFYEEGPRRKIPRNLGAVTSFFQRQARTLAEHPWEILQIIEVSIFSSFMFPCLV